MIKNLKYSYWTLIINTIYKIFLKHAFSSPLIMLKFNIFNKLHTIVGIIKLPRGLREKFTAEEHSFTTLREIIHYYSTGSY